MHLKDNIMMCNIRRNSVDGKANDNNMTVS